HEVDVACFEAWPHRVTSLGSLGSTARGLTLRAFTTTDASLVFLRSGGWAQVVHLEHLRTRGNVSRRGLLRRSLLRWCLGLCLGLRSGCRGFSLGSCSLLLRRCLGLSLGRGGLGRSL